MASCISPLAKIGENVTVGEFAVIEAGAVIGDGCRIGHHAVVCEGTHLGKNVEVGIGAVIGRQPRLARTSTVKASALPPLEVGDDSIIGAYAVVSAGTKLGKNVMVADMAGVRERCELGDNVVVGRGATVENDTTIGARTKIQTGAYVTAYMTIEEDVFIAPMVTTTNDNYMGRTEKRFAEKRGAIIRRGARVGGNAVLLPGVVIDSETFVAAGSVVTRDTKPGTVMMGVPAKERREVPAEELLDGERKA